MSGLGNALRMQAYGSGFGHRFVFGDTLRIQAWVWLAGFLFWLWADVLASGIFVESNANAGMRDSFGIGQLSAKPGEKQKYYEVSQKELEAQRWESVFLLLIRKCSQWKGETHMA